MSESELTPCNGKCFVDPDTTLCVGCMRTPDEIADWSNYTEEKKLRIINSLEDRKQRLNENN